MGNLAIVRSASCPQSRRSATTCSITPEAPPPRAARCPAPARSAGGTTGVLYLGDPRVLPVPAGIRDGIAFAVVDDGPLDFTDRWSAPQTDADEIVVDASTASPTARRCAPVHCSRRRKSGTTCCRRSTARSRPPAIRGYYLYLAEHAGGRLGAVDLGQHDESDPGRPQTARRPRSVEPSAMRLSASTTIWSASVCGGDHRSVNSSGPSWTTANTMPVRPVLLAGHRQHPRIADVDAR